MRMKGIRSIRERACDVDPRLRKFCLIEDDERGYSRSVLSRFNRRVGAERLRRIINEKVVMLLRRSEVEKVDMILNTSFIKAVSIRHPRDDMRGFSDPDARVGWHGRDYNLGCKLHVSVDHQRILPLASVLALANEKRHGPTLIERIREILRKAGARLRSLVADSQYSSGRMWGLVDETVIPFMANQRQGENVLWVDKKFRTQGPEEKRVRYYMRPVVEAAYAFLKNQYGIAVNKDGSLGSVVVYALYSVLCHVLTKEAAEHIGRPEKALSPTFFNT